MDNSNFEPQQCEWNSLNSFKLGVVRDALEDSAAVLPSEDDLDYGPHPSDLTGSTEHVTTRPRAGTDACQANAPVGVIASQTRQPMRVR